MPFPADGSTDVRQPAIAMGGALMMWTPATAAMCGKVGLFEPTLEMGVISEVRTIGLDLVKTVFQIHGADASGAIVFRKQLRCRQLLEFLGRQPHCLVAMEACGSSHFWAREIGRLGDEVRMIPPAYVKSFVKPKRTT